MQIRVENRTDKRERSADNKYPKTGNGANAKAVRFGKTKTTGNDAAE
jgi:hypothetical protein